VGTFTRSMKLILLAGSSDSLHAHFRELDGFVVTAFVQGHLRQLEDCSC
jgi:hypothetical protein